MRLVSLIVGAQFRDLMVEIFVFSECMSAGVILSGEVESEFFDIVEHVGMVLADPSGATINGKVFDFLKPLIAIRAIFQALPQGQRANPATISL